MPVNPAPWNSFLAAKRSWALGFATNHLLALGAAGAALARSDGRLKKKKRNAVEGEGKESDQTVDVR